MDASSILIDTECRNIHCSGGGCYYLCPGKAESLIIRSVYVRLHSECCDTDVTSSGAEVVEVHVARYGVYITGEGAHRL